MKYYIGGIEIHDFNLSQIASFDETSDTITSITLVPSANEETDFSIDLIGTMPYSMLGIDLADNSKTAFSIQAQTPYQIQKRTHKKKRINKKWAKRYGYITKFKNIELVDCQLNYLDNEQIQIDGRYKNDILEC